MDAKVTTNNPSFMVESKKGKKTFLPAILYTGDTKADVKILSSGSEVESKQAASMRILVGLMLEHGVGNIGAWDTDSFKAAVVQAECEAFGGVPQKDNPQKRDGGKTLPAEWSVAKSDFRGYIKATGQLPYHEKESGEIYIKPRAYLMAERKKLAPVEEKDAFERLKNVLNSVIDPAVADQMAALCMERKDQLIDAVAKEAGKEAAVVLAGVSMKE